MELPPFVWFTKTVHHEAYDRISPLRPELSARGKNIIVTGGGSGIGRATAIEFARAGAASVSILGRRIEQLVASSNDITAAATDKSTKVFYHAADLVKRDEVDKAFQSISAKVGKIDILVSNAGSLPAPGPLTGYDSSVLLNTLEVNVVASFNAVQAFLAVAIPEPTIVNTSSGAAHMSLPGASMNHMMKAASYKIFTSFAVENPNLHIVSYHPGLVATAPNTFDVDKRKSLFPTVTSAERLADTRKQPPCLASSVCGLLLQKPSS